MCTHARRGRSTCDDVMTCDARRAALTVENMFFCVCLCVCVCVCVCVLDDDDDLPARKAPGQEGPDVRQHPQVSLPSSLPSSLPPLSLILSLSPSLPPSLLSSLPPARPPSLPPALPPARPPSLSPSRPHSGLCGGVSKRAARGYDGRTSARESTYAHEYRTQGRRTGEGYRERPPADAGLPFMDDPTAGEEDEEEVDDDW